MEYIKYLDTGNVRSEILNEESSFILTGYYWGTENVNRNSTKKLTYGEQAERLIGQCKKFKINYYFVDYPVFHEKKMYQIALGLKGEFVMKCLNMFPKFKVINIDTDLQINQFPHVFEMNADCFFINWNEYSFNCYNPYQIELPGAILGFANNHGARTMLRILNDYMIKNLHLAEDKSFSGIITGNFMNTYLRCVWLPFSYLYMFENHIYDPSLRKYTKVVDIKEELKNSDSGFKQTDLVLIHEDFETGELEDVFNDRVGKLSRWPPNVYRQFGKKLRCMNVKFKNFVDFGLNKKQSKQYSVDFKSKEKGGVVKNMSIQRSPAIKGLKQVYKNVSENKYIIVSLVDDTIESDEIVRFVNKCERFNIDCIIYSSSSKSYRKVDKSLLIKSVLTKFKKNVVYLDIHYQVKKNPLLFEVKNMDFMTVNLNNTHIQGYLCSDMRVLRTINENLYFFAYNDLTLQFLDIWHQFNTDLMFQHKNLEYAFNVSLAINKMRCYWFPKDYLMGPTLKFDKKFKAMFLNDKYPSKDKKIKSFSKNIQQCGIKPTLIDGEAAKTHHFGSKSGSASYNKYGKFFLEF